MLYLLLFITGTAVGSFLNVLIDRLPQEETIMGRSHCDYCKKKLEWMDLIPVISFVFLGGKCRRCKKKLSFFYPLVELITGAAFVGVLTWLGTVDQTVQTVNLEEALLSLHSRNLMLIALLGIVSSAIVIFFADFKYQIIPDSIQVALFGFSFLYLSTQGLTPEIFLHHVLAAFITMLPILLLFLLTKGKGMGFGDVKLAFTMGFLLGVIGGLAAVYIGFITGAVIGIILIIFKKRRLKSKIAFGPFLIIGLTSALFFNYKIDQIIRSIYPL
jgi:leader peptidase (prepilin peptidase)/N-methyltransferase